jgi:hypothetical protein
MQMDDDLVESIPNILDRFQVDPQYGLNELQVAENLLTYGKNELEIQDRRSI